MTTSKDGSTAHPTGHPSSDPIPCNLQLNSEHTRGEGVCWYIECVTPSHIGYARCPTMRYARKLDIETGFWGRGAKQQAQAALKRVEQLPEQMTHSQEKTR